MIWSQSISRTSSGPLGFGTLNVQVSCMFTVGQILQVQKAYNMPITRYLSSRLLKQGSALRRWHRSRLLRPTYDSISSGNRRISMCHSMHRIYCLQRAREVMTLLNKINTSWACTYKGGFSRSNEALIVKILYPNVSSKILGRRKRYVQPVYFAIYMGIIKNKQADFPFSANPLAPFMYLASDGRDPYLGG